MSVTKELVLSLLLGAAIGLVGIGLIAWIR